MKRSKPDPHSPSPIALITGEAIHMYELLILPNHPSTTQTHKFPWLRLIHNYKASVHQRTTEDAVAQNKRRGGGPARWPGTVQLSSLEEQVAPTPRSGLP